MTLDPTRPAIITIGNFDGVHLGHQKLVRQSADRAGALGMCSMAVTFEPHPEQVLFPERKLMHLSTPEEKVEILQSSGMDRVWICPFTVEVARMEPEDFIRMLIERQPMAELWVGSDFALGRGRRGTIAVLSEIGSAMGWGLHMVPPLMLEGQVVSSTAIRTLLSAGAVRGAADLLGRNYSVPGDVSGRELLVDPLRTLPRAMTYEGVFHQAGQSSDALLTIVAQSSRIHIDTEAPLTHAAARAEFIRRRD